MDDEKDLLIEAELEGGRAESLERKARWSDPHLKKHGTLVELTADTDSALAGGKIAQIWWT